MYGKKLGRNKNERTALFKSLVQELILHGTITTTQSKAKAIKGLVDKIINLAKNKNSQRLLSAYFTNKLLQERLISEIVPKLGSRVSGYTTTMRVGVREGDRTTVVKMSIIGNENLKPLEKITSNRAQGKVKKTEEVKKPVVKQSLRSKDLKKAAPVKKITAKKTISKRRLSKTK